MTQSEHEKTRVARRPNAGSETGWKNYLLRLRTIRRHKYSTKARRHSTINRGMASFGCIIPAVLIWAGLA